MHVIIEKGVDQNQEIVREVDQENITEEVDQWNVNEVDRENVKEEAAPDLEIT